MINELILNSTLLITLTVLFGFITRAKYTGFAKHILPGLLFGGITVIGMNFPVSVADGIFYDGRSIILSMAGLFGGYPAAIISVIVAGGYRIYLGGGGIWAGTSSIILSIAIGLLFRFKLKNKPENITASALFVMGVIVHIVILACQLLLPKESVWQVIREIWLPIILIFPGASLLMGLILRNEKRRVIAEARIEESEAQHRTTLLSIGDGVITTDNRGTVTFMNDMAEKLTGWKEAEALGKPIGEIFRIISESTREKTDSPVEKVLKEGLTIGLANHTLLLTRDNREIPITDSGAPIKDSEGRTTGVVLVFKDQTDERRLKNKLIESERLFHSLTDKSPVGIFRTDKNGQTTYVNPRWCEISGLSFEQAMGDKWLDSVHPDDRKRVTENWQKDVSINQQSKTEYRFLKANGAVTYIMGVAVPELSSEEEVTGYIGTVVDITERKLAQKELIQSHENFRLTIDDLPLGVRIVSNEGKTTYLNKAFLDLYGFADKEEYNRTPVSSRYTPASYEEHELRKQRRKAGLPEQTEYEVEIITQAADTKNLLVIRKLIFWDGQMQNLAIYQDFTDRKVAENKLQLLGRAVDQSPVSTVITDNQGKIIYVNPKFTEVSGYDQHEVIGRSSSILKSGKHPREFYDELWKTILAGNDWKGEFLNKQKNGVLFWESTIISSIVDDKGEITHFVGAKEDITEKKKFISELRRAKEKAEESDRLKSAFLANMSHEIRTPLNAILGFTNLLVEDEDMETEAKQEIEAILKQSSENLLQVINDIIDISKIETGQLKIFNTSFNVGATILDIYKVSQHQLQRYNKEHLKINSHVPNQELSLFTDKVRFTQVLNNLLNNAIKFTMDGEINFGIKSFTESEVTFFVSDTGIGIEPEKLTSIFERFRQADDSTTRVYGGSGLGLSISKELIKQMGGTLTVESIVGKGTTFHFTLPLEK
ncbi:PAS domain S-box protein [Mangrovibacterium sp.]|uniref:PAS domain S-box protein n=1 Tax=Mangrovibacterium sp. TaxID=1961364 RepID=UPI003565030A